MMKVKQLYIIVGFVLASMVSCTNEDLRTELTDEGSRIYLSAGIAEPVSSRTPYHPTDGTGNALNAPTSDHPLNVSVWASTTAGYYPDNDLNGSTGTVETHTQAHFQSGTPQLLGEAIYPKAEDNSIKTVYFVGLHPQSTNWTPSDDKKSANLIFTGKEDVMWAPQISGTYGTEFDASPQFHFYHLLTWLRVEMVADKDENDVLKKDDVADAWGLIKSMTISSTNQVGIDLTKNDDEVNKVNLHNQVTFGSSPTSLKFYHTGTDDAFDYPVDEDDKGYRIPNEQTEVAYVMCAPVIAAYQHLVDGKEVLKPEYTLHIKTEKRELDIPIDLKVNADVLETSYFTRNTMGNQFTVVLNFKMGNVISVSAKIELAADTDWYTHGTGTSDVKEGDLDE